MYKVFIVEDEFLVREGIRNNIDWDKTQYVLSGESSDGEMALAMIQEIKPDILVTDIRMPFMDGLALSRVVKRTMPWMRIIILSGHDEFEYAREAISIGVDEYILKPINSTLLLSTMDKVVTRLEEAKSRQLDVERLQAQLKSASALSKVKFLEEWIMGAVNTSDAIDQARKWNMDLLAKRYLAVEVKFDMEQNEYPDMLTIQAYVGNLMRDRNDVIWFFRSFDRLVLILKGEESIALNESAYELAQAIRYELERNTVCKLTIGIGSAVERMGAIPKSYADASKALRFIGDLRNGQIVGIRDIESGEICRSFMLPSETSIGEKLRYACKEDIPNLVGQWMKKIDGTNFQSALMGYYLLMDMLMTSSRLISEIGGEPRAILPEIDNPARLFSAASSPESFSKLATGILEKTLDFRDSSESMKYGRIIHKAREFINRNYSDSAISLHTVAAEIALSPNHFSTIFSQETGETFIEYLTRVRIDQAKKLLAESNMRLADIAYAIGYNEAHYFSFIFKKHTGLTPREFRSQSHNTSIL